MVSLLFLLLLLDATLGYDCNETDGRCTDIACNTTADCLVGRHATWCHSGIYCAASRCCRLLDHPCPRSTRCVAEARHCLKKPCNNDTDCQDGLFCNGREQCVRGHCRSVPCSHCNGLCDETGQRCQHPSLWAQWVDYRAAGITTPPPVTQRPGPPPVTHHPEPPPVAPSRAPSRSPTGYPSLEPTLKPTVSPTVLPTVAPTLQPTVTPTETPTLAPTLAPTTAQPTEIPTLAPTSLPTTEPTSSPTVEPSVEPTVEPTGEPTLAPTTEPTTQPTEEPTLEPTQAPTHPGSCFCVDVMNGAVHCSLPNVTGGCGSIVCTIGVIPYVCVDCGPSCIPPPTTCECNTVEPTGAPSLSPTVEPTSEPSLVPTQEPTGEPSEAPTSEPTTQPTVQPTSAPTQNPTMEPTGEPSVEPTGEPSRTPTLQPTAEPTNEATEEPTSSPTEFLQPTEEPTLEPSSAPTTEQPTEAPTHPGICYCLDTLNGNMQCSAPNVTLGCSSISCTISGTPYTCVNCGPSCIPPPENCECDTPAPTVEVTEEPTPEPV